MIPLNLPVPDVACPDCGDPWPDSPASCRRCGLTIETIAERIANDG